MQDMQDIIRRLNQSGKRLSKGHRRIAEYIVAHYDKAVFMTASRLGENVGVSESTVVRFAAALGYEGYPQLQRSLQELVRHRLTAVQRFEMSSEIDRSAVLRTVLKADLQNHRPTTEEIDTAAFEDVVQRALKARIVIVSPSILMLSIQVVQALLRDVKMREEDYRIQTEVRALLGDVGRLDERVRKLQTHFTQAAGDIGDIVTSSTKIVKRGERIEAMEFDEARPEQRLAGE